MYKLLGHDKVIIRFISLYIFGLILFFVSWTIAYFLLPEGMLQDFGILAGLANSTSESNLGQEFIVIFSLNLLGFIPIIVASLILSVRGISFGYLIPLAWMIMYALILGTNSFSFQMEASMSPSFEVFTRSGVYEMMAYVLMATAINTI